MIPSVWHCWRLLYLRRTKILQRRSQQERCKWQEELETQAISSLDGVMARVPVEALAATNGDMSSGESTSEGSISGGESETSHSEGQPMETESSTSSDESVEMDHEAMMSEAPGTTETLNKGQRRRVLDAVQKVG